MSAMAKHRYKYRIQARFVCHTTHTHRHAVPKTERCHLIVGIS